ncbi:calcium homeostasis modulator protein 4-like isoform X3 [Lethenteron reissneri]|uniref:calcium homeostasis modulator protein 4-like isoform X3 n=1 Tax=Lethenteron reissneri TaxID=7753 RepID=UPI002AB6D96E|nr:calcium homeostasis modulator protein 4-like isoform X3 [Lethenteron reissneri]
MSGRLLGSLFKLASSLRDYMPSLVTGVLMPVMIACAQPLFGLFAFHCPCTSPENWSYTLWALAAPFGVVSVVGFTIQLCTTLRAADTLARKYGCDNCCCRFVFFVGASLFRNVTFMFAAMAWPILALFDGSYVVCGGTEVLDWTRFPALGNLSHLGERQRRSMLARVPCKELKEPFPGLVTNETHDDIREQIALFLRASSQDIKAQPRYGEYPVWGMEVSLLLADDVVLFTSSICDLQHALEWFDAECEAAEMRISTSKSEVMVYSRQMVDCSL